MHGSPADGHEGLVTCCLSLPLSLSLLELMVHRQTGDAVWPQRKSEEMSPGMIACTLVLSTDCLSIHENEVFDGKNTEVFDGKSITQARGGRGSPRGRLWGSGDCVHTRPVRGLGFQSGLEYRHWSVGRKVWG